MTNQTAPLTLIIIGGGGHAKVVIETARETGLYQHVQVLEDKEEVVEVLGAPVIGRCLDYEELAAPDTVFFVAIGNNTIRKRYITALREAGCSLVTLVHPSAVVSPSAVLEEGVLVMPGAVINAQVSIGAGCIINTGATVDHDCTIGEFTHIAPGVNLAGSISIGRETLMGVGSNALPGVSIGDRVTVGAGATVCNNVQHDLTVVGTPAKRVNYKE